MTEATRTIVLRRGSGLHARPAMQFAEKANEFDCDVILYNNDKQANGKSIITLLALEAQKGSTLIIKTRGADAEAAAAALAEVLIRAQEEGEHDRQKSAPAPADGAPRRSE